MTGKETEIREPGDIKKDPLTMNSDIPVDPNAWLRDLSDDELWGLYNKYNEHDDKPDAPTDDIDDINDRVINKNALIAEMNRRGLFDKPDEREHHVN